MRTQRILAAVAATLVGLVGGLVLAPVPAQAGNWAVTVVDPLPDRLEPGKGYTVGLWVLQHGFHPYEGDLGKVALRLVDAKGTSLSFTAVALPEPAHYAAAVALPHPGTWAVIGVQGRFTDYQIGTLTVPGRLWVLGVPAPMQPAETEKHWPGAIRPPVVPVDLDRDPFAQVAAVAPAGEGGVATALPVAGTAPADVSSPRAVSVGIAILVVAVAVAGLVAGCRRLRVRLQPPGTSGPA